MCRLRRSASWAAVATTTLLLLPGMTEPVSAQTPRTDMSVTNGVVNTVVEAGGIVYLGGSFTQVYRPTGGGAPLDSVTGAALRGSRVVGQVLCVAADGSGGWYLGGTFTAIGTTARQNIAHIGADGSVSAWNPGANASVRTLAISGGIVYAGGDFTTIGGQNRNRIAAIDAASGLATSWNPNATSGSVFAIAVGPGLVYAGGSFLEIGGQKRHRIAALDPSTGLAASGWDPGAGNNVRALVLSGSTLYVGGEFQLLGGVTRRRIGSLAASTGAVNAWNPNAPSGIVYAIAVSGTVVYVGGDFSNIGGQTRNDIAALDAGTGSATAWNPNASGGVLALAVRGNRVYAGGPFSTIGGQARNGLADLDASTGLASAWNPNPDGDVYALAVKNGQVYAGGTFTVAGAQTRNNIAAIDAVTGVLTAWNPNASDFVHAIAVSGGTVYAGGRFASIGGQTRNRLAALSAATGLATAWNPAPNQDVTALAVSGNTVYAGGQFNMIAGITRQRIAALDATTGTATGWNPGISGGGSTSPEVILVRNGAVYLGGSFSAVGGQTRDRIAAVDSATGAVLPWNPAASGGVNALAHDGETIYAGGQFTTIGGQTRNRIAALDVGSGIATSWNPNASSDVNALVVRGDRVYAGGGFATIGGRTLGRMAVLDASSGLALDWNPNVGGTVNSLYASGGSVYVGGTFATIGGQAQPNFAAVAEVLVVSAVTPAQGADSGSVATMVSGFGLQSGAAAKLMRAGYADITGSAISVTPDGTSLSATFNLTGKAQGAWDLVVTNPGAIVAGVTTDTLRNSFSITPGTLLGRELRRDLHVTDGQVYAMAEAGGKLYIGGLFSRVGPPTGGGVPLHPTTGLPLGLPRIEGTVYAVVADGAGGWYVGGAFTVAGGMARSNLAHVAVDHTVSAWNPGANGEVRALALDGGIVYAGGSFTSIGGQSRNRIAAISASTGAPTSWSPNANGAVHALLAYGSTVYAGGDFTTIGGAARNRIAALDASTGSATAWNPDANARVSALGIFGSTVYAGGSFTNVGGAGSEYVAGIDAASGNVVPNWNMLDVNGPVLALLVSGPTLYIGGQFTIVDGALRSRIASISTSGHPAVTAWNPNANGVVEALALSGTTVYAGGVFTNIGGQVRGCLAALHFSTGAVEAWDPGAKPRVTALAASGSVVFTGGTFGTIGGAARSNLAAIDLATGSVTSWNPGTDWEVEALAVGGATVYAGGSFSSAGGQTRNRAAAFDTATGTLTSWNPDANDRVLALVPSGSVVYAGGYFTDIGGQSRFGLAALDAVTGTATAWDPSPAQAPGLSTSGNIVNVRAIAVEGNAVYVGGYFNSIGGQSRGSAAALDATTASATPWNPDPGGFLYALALSPDAVYLGGDFQSVGGQSRNGLAAVDRTAGMVTPWNPAPNGLVEDIQVRGGTVYVGGSFTIAGGAARNRIAALDADNAVATPWNPNADGPVRSLTLIGTKIYAGGAFSMMAGVPRASLAAMAEAVTIDTIVPNQGSERGSITVRISGEGFQAGVVPKLVRSGQAAIVGTQAEVDLDGAILTTVFDLSGRALGVWDLVVTNPDSTNALLPNAFTIEPAEPYRVRVDVIGSPKMRPNRARAFDVVLENLGNTDVLSLPLWISRIPVDATIALDFPLASPVRDAGEPDWTLAPISFVGPSGRYLALMIPRLGPGVSVLRVYLTVPNSVGSFVLDAALAPPWANGVPFRSCLSPVIASPTCMGSLLDVLNDSLAATPGIRALNGIGLWAKIAWQCEGAASLPAALVEAQQALDFMHQPIDHAGIPSGCEISLVPQWQDTLAVTLVSSTDPNDKYGTDGIGPARQIPRDETLYYTIRFENLQTASAWAQDVVVFDAIDMVRLDLESTFSLGQIKFGRKADGLPWTITPPPGLTSYTTCVDLRPQIPLIVRVSVHLDRATGVLGWSLMSVDPATVPSAAACAQGQEIPDESEVGFLPPNVTSPEGEGSVSFSVKPRAGVPSGSQIRNLATIVFDGDPTQTPEWLNTVDYTPPQSHVLPLGDPQDSLSFTVRWQATGSPEDLCNFNVYVSQDGRPYEEWRVQTTATADTIARPGGHFYYFYSRASDSTGNLELPPPMPDGQTFSRAAVEPNRSPLALALEGAVPNPATGAARVWFALPSRERAVLEVIDVAGRRVWRRDVSELGPGRHSADVSAGTRRPGLYFLKLTQGNRTLHARMMVIR